MKVVINKKYGGFSLSPRAIQRLAELQGRECYFFTYGKSPSGGMDFELLAPCTLKEAAKAFRFTAYDTPNPPSQKGFQSWSMDRRQASNAEMTARSLDNRPDDRSDPLLVRVVEELGDAASGAHAALKIIEIPDGVEYEIHDYDGMESVHEKHESWG